MGEGSTFSQISDSSTADSPDDTCEAYTEYASRRSDTLSRERGLCVRFDTGS